MATVHTAEARIVAKDMATPAIQAVRNSISGLNTATDVLNRGFGAGLASSFGKATLAGSAFGLVVAGLNGRLAALAARAQDVSEVATSFQTLTARVGASGDEMIRSLQPALEGMVSNMEIMKTVNKAVIMDLPVTTENMAEMAVAAEKLSDAMGTDLAQTFDKLVESIGKMQARGLKELGIFVDGEEVNRRLAASLGVTVDALTETQKHLGFYTEAMRQANAITAGMAESTPTLAHYYNAIGVAAKNAADRVMLLANVVGGAWLTAQVKLAKMVPGGEAAINMLGWGNLGAGGGGVGGTIDPRINPRLGGAFDFSGWEPKKAGKSSSADAMAEFYARPHSFMGDASGAYEAWLEITNPQRLDPFKAGLVDISETTKEIAEEWWKIPPAIEGATTFAQDLNMTMREGAVYAALDFGNALVDAIATGRSNWREFFSQMLANFAKMILQAQILKAAMSWNFNGSGMSKGAVSNAANAGISAISAIMGGPGVGGGLSAAAPGVGGGFTINYNIDARGAGPGVGAEVQRAIAAAQSQTVTRAVAAVSDQYGRGGNFKRSLT